MAQKHRVTPRAVLMAICIAALATGCLHTVDGAALAAEQPNHSAVTTSPAPRAADSGAGRPATDSMTARRATGRGESGVQSDLELALVHTFTTTSDSSSLIDDHTCIGRASVGDVTTYSNSGYIGIRGNQFSTPNAVQVDIAQVVASFGTAADAQAVLARARQAWQACANGRYGFHSSNGNHSYFGTENLRGTHSRIELSMRQEEDAR